MVALSSEPGRGHEIGKPLLLERKYALAFAVVTSMFFMWAIANNFNDILIKQFQKSLELSRMQSGLVQTAFYFGYFTFALPAGWFISQGWLQGRDHLRTDALCRRRGAVLSGCGACAVFGFFLVALYIIAAGLAFLETAANPLIAAMGSPGTAAQRLNLAQSFNGLGGVMAPFLGSALILSGIEHNATDLAAMSPAQVEAYRTGEALAVQTPYLGLAGVVACLAVLVMLTRFPPIREAAIGTQATDGRRLLAIPRLRAAVITQFFYVGAQVTVWSYFINFSQDISGVGEKVAAHYLGYSLFGFMVGRFAGTAFMRFIAPPRLLALYGIISALLCLVAISATGMIAIVALGLTSFFMSIMFPTIFSLGVAGLESRTRIASSLVVMAIIGGAIFPPLTGFIGQQTGSLQLAMAVPLLSFVVVAFFGFNVARQDAGVPR